MNIEISKRNPNYFGKIPTNCTKIKIEVDFSESSVKNCLLRLYNAPFLMPCILIEFNEKLFTKIIFLTENQVNNYNTSNYCLEIEPSLIDLETGKIRADIQI